MSFQLDILPSLIALIKMVNQCLSSAILTWLASMGEWAYVECTGSQLLRGFVLQEALEFLE